MSKHVISCFPSGLVESVQSDELPLSEFGRVQMTRASDVLWDDHLQKWRATIRPEFRKKEFWDKSKRCPWVFFHKSRAKCIEWELEYLNDR